MRTRIAQALHALADRLDPSPEASFSIQTPDYTLSIPAVTGFELEGLLQIREAFEACRTAAPRG